MQVNISSLSADVLSKIPLSIRLNSKNNILNVDDLPIEVAYELRNSNLNSSDIAPYVDPSTVDIIPKLSVYTDFLSLTSKNNAIIEYVKNFLLIDKGDYPFDPTFGTEIKKFLQRLDTSTTMVLVNNELRNITYALSLAFNVPITILKSKVVPVDNAVSAEYRLIIELEVEDVKTTLTFSKSIESYYLM